MRKVAMLNRVLRRWHVTAVPDWDFTATASARHIRALIEKYQIDCVIDVGANLGQFRDFIVEKVGWTGPVVSFEPVSDYFNVISRRATPNWQVFNYALGSSESEQSITVFDSPGLASIRAPDLKAMQKVLPKGSVAIEKTETIRIKRLCDVFPQILGERTASRIFLKMDTQGFDLEVFRGADALLPLIKIIQTELSFLGIYESAPEYSDVLSEMRTKGYAVSGMFPVTYDEKLRAVEMDCLLVRE